MRPIILSLLALASFGLAGHAAVIQVDMDRSEDPNPQSGWSQWLFSGNSFSPRNANAAFGSADATDGTIDVNLSTTTNAGGRNYGLGNVTDAPNLALPNVWADQVFFNNNTSGSMTLTVNDLKAGRYTFSSYHYANALNGGPNNDEGVARVQVNTGSGFVDTGVQQAFVSGVNSNVAGSPITASNLENFGTLSLNFKVAADNDPVAISFDNLNGIGGGDTFGINGFQLASVPDAAVMFHDLGATAGQASTGNVTTHQTSGPTPVSLDTSPRALIDYATGSPTGVFVSIEGANGVDTRNGGETRAPFLGTPADALFNVPGLNLSNGMIFEGGNNGSGLTTFTFTGLDSALVYDLALYGDRAASLDGPERFILTGADAATNSSTAGIIDDFITDFQTRPNADVGGYVRYVGIEPGADGMFSLTVDPEFTSLSNIAYLSAFRLESMVPVPEPGTMALLGILGCAAVFIRRRQRRSNG